jgi:hypothetical protein
MPVNGYTFLGTLCASVHERNSCSDFIVRKATTLFNSPLRADDNPISRPFRSTSVNNLIKISGANLICIVQNWMLILPPALLPFASFLLFAILPDFYVKSATSQAGTKHHLLAFVHSLQALLCAFISLGLASRVSLSSGPSCFRHVRRFAGRSSCRPTNFTLHVARVVICLVVIHHMALQRCRSFYALSPMLSASLFRTSSQPSLWRKFAARYYALPFFVPLLLLHAYRLTSPRRCPFLPSFANGSVRARPFFLRSSVY